MKAQAGSCRSAQGCAICHNFPPEVAGRLVHEAVHVWQRYCDHIGERRPGNEQEAYGIQSIAQELMQSFVEQTAC